MSDGVRVLDLRIAGFRSHPDSKAEYWCAHTFLTVPFRKVIHEVKTFLKENPSESVIVLMNPDYSTINADYLGLVNISRKQRQRVFKPSRQDLLEICKNIDVTSYLEEDQLSLT